VTIEDANNTPKRELILLTGATGYVGGRLLKELERSGMHVRCVARNPEGLKPRAAAYTEVVRGDVTDEASMRSAMVGVDTAFYMVHSMGSTSSFETLDRQGAENFARAAKDAGVRRIIYLGGLGDSSAPLSPHLRSRHEVGDILRTSGVQVLEFQASIVLGSGSLSFEMIRALVERLPVMVTPKWTAALAQPIAVTDLVAYLLAAIKLPFEGSLTVQIGGPDRVSYGDLMREYANQRGLRRYMIRVPVLTPRLSSLWLGLVTPLYARVGRKLIDSIQHSTIVRDNSAAELFSIRPVGIKQAISLALRNEDREFAETRWSDATSSSGIEKTWGGVRFGSRLVDSRTVHVRATPAAAFKPIRRIGGSTGWYYLDFLWRIRGILDLLVGGVGVRRGRRDPETVSAGDAIDFWRVEEFEPGRMLRLAAEMKLPGRAWLEFEVTQDDSGSSIRQTALFDPVGLFGLVYWYALYPLHQLVFAGMLRNIAREAETQPT